MGESFREKMRKANEGRKQEVAEREVSNNDTIIETVVEEIAGTEAVETPKVQPASAKEDHISEMALQPQRRLSNAQPILNEDEDLEETCTVRKGMYLKESAYKKLMYYKKKYNYGSMNSFLNDLFLSLDVLLDR